MAANARSGAGGGIDVQRCIALYRNLVKLVDSYKTSCREELRERDALVEQWRNTAQEHRSLHDRLRAELEERDQKLDALEAEVKVLRMKQRSPQASSSCTRCTQLSFLLLVIVNVGLVWMCLRSGELTKSLQGNYANYRHKADLAKCNADVAMLSSTVRRLEAAQQDHGSTDGGGLYGEAPSPTPALGHEKRNTSRRLPNTPPAIAFVLEHPLTVKAQSLYVHYCSGAHRS